MKSLFRANPGFARLIAAQIPADLADWLAFVAVAATLAYGWQAPPLAFALLGLAMGLPYVVIGPFAGALVDRWRLGPVLVWSNLGRGLGVLAYGLAPGWPALVVLVALVATVDSFFTPAKQAALQALVRPEDRAAANGLSQGVNQISKIAGPALGGGLLALTGPVPVFVLTAVASALAAALALGLPLPAREPRPEHSPRIFRDIAEGLALVRRTPALRAALGLMAAGFFGIFLYDTLIAPLMESLGHGPETLGLCVAANGLGGVTGALLGGPLMKRRPFVWVAASFAVGGTLVGAMGVAALTGIGLPAPLLAAAFLTVGLSGAGSVVPIRTVIQNATPEPAMARVAALSEAASAAALLVAPLAGAGLATIGGIGLPFVVGAGVALLTAVTAALAARRLP